MDESIDRHGGARTNTNTNLNTNRKIHADKLAHANFRRPAMPLSAHAGAACRDASHLRQSGGANTRARLAHSMHALATVSTSALGAGARQLFCRSCMRYARSLKEWPAIKQILDLRCACVCESGRVYLGCVTGATTSREAPHEVAEGGGGAKAAADRPRLAACHWPPATGGLLLTAHWPPPPAAEYLPPGTGRRLLAAYSWPPTTSRLHHSAYSAYCPPPPATATADVLLTGCDWPPTTSRPLLATDDWPPSWQTIGSRIRPGPQNPTPSHQNAPVAPFPAQFRAREAEAG